MPNLTELLDQAHKQILADQTRFRELVQSSNFTPLKDVQRIFGANYRGSETVCPLYEKEFGPIHGVLVSPFMLEALAKAGHIIMYEPVISLKEIIEKTAGIPQHDGVVKYYSDQFDLKGSITKPWFKDVSGFDFSPYILDMTNVKHRFVIFKPAHIDNTSSKRVSAQLPLNKEYVLDILGNTISQGIKTACDSITPEILKCVERLEVKAPHSATGVVLSLPFTKILWPDLQTAVFQYATLATTGEKLVTHRGMYHRVCSPSPDGNILMFGSSEDGSYVGGDGADYVSSDVAVGCSCIGEIV